VLDIATGKGEFIVQLAARYLISGVAVDISPFCIADARAKLQARAPSSNVQFLTMDGAAYQPVQPASFDLAACIGASWVFQGHRNTLAYLQRQTRRGGWVIAGEPYWIQKPPQAYLEALGESEETYASHAGNAEIGEALGLKLRYTIVSSHDDWDRYEGLQWNAAQRYASEHPDDPDCAEVLNRVESSKWSYLRWGRETLGWAMYIFENEQKAG
jgi:SAM-dependent methyltransferase